MSFNDWLSIFLLKTVISVQDLRFSTDLKVRVSFFSRRAAVFSRLIVGGTIGCSCSAGRVFVFYSVVNGSKGVK